MTDPARPIAGPTPADPAAPDHRPESDRPADQGLAVTLAHPRWLRERNCFQLLRSRAVYKRVTGIWVSKHAPRLGWCWGGNPHTWLGMASGTARIQAPAGSGRYSSSASGQAR